MIPPVWLTWSHAILLPDGCGGCGASTPSLMFHLVATVLGTLVGWLVYALLYLPSVMIPAYRRSLVNMGIGFCGCTGEYCTGDDRVPSSYCECTSCVGFFMFTSIVMTGVLVVVTTVLACDCIALATAAASKKKKAD